jgi:hypothetical protein
MAFEYRTLFVLWETGERLAQLSVEALALLPQTREDPMRKLVSILGATGACLLLVVAVTAQDNKDERKSEAKADDYDLSIKFIKDLTSNYRLSQVTTTKMEIMDNKQDSTITNDYECTQTCTAIDKEGNATLEMKYTRAVLKKIENEEETLNYDSKNDKLEDLEEGDRLKALLAGHTFTATISREGKVNELEGYDAYKESVAEKVGEEYAAMLESVAGDVTMRDAMESSYRILPKERVAIGGTWEASWEMPISILGTAKYKATYTLKAIVEKEGRKCAHATVIGEMSLEQGEDAAFKVAYKDVDWKGDLWIDVETRETVLSDTTLKFTMEMDMGMKIVAPSEVRMVFELIQETATKKGED